MVIARTPRFSNVLAVAACCAWICPGCNHGDGVPNRLETAPVTGTVRRHDGSPLPKGFVHVEVVDGPNVTVSGVVDAGRFSLTTNCGSAAMSGAAQGRYRFVVVPDFRVEPKPVRFERVYELGGSGTHVVLDLPAN